MSRERKYQQGKFEQYYTGRNELSGGITRGGNDFEVRRKHSIDVGGFRDPERPGIHRGKGPRDYRRRDERVVEDINDRLCDNPYIDASEIDIHVAQGNVVLSGTVEDRQSKRLAEDIIESVSGVQNIENTLKVRKRGI